MEAQSSKFKAQNKFQGFKLQLVLERKAALALGAWSFSCALSFEL